jgi:hypothetical protein
MLPYNTHDIKLHFNLKITLEQTMLNKWIEFIEQCENSKNKEIVTNWLSNCKLSTKYLPYLEGSVGGIGGDNNKINKQLRFYPKYLYKYLYNNIYSIVINVIYTQYEQWTITELDDLITAFVKTANNYLNLDCVIGHISLENKNET